MTVHFAKSIATSNDYKKLNMSSLKESTYRGGLDAPAPEALARRWKKFNK
jgi:hypothetical protein